MVDTTSATVSAKYSSGTTAWNGILEVTLTNQSGAPLEDPVVVAFDMPIEISPTTNTGFNVENSGQPTTHIVGTLAPELTPVAEGQSVTFLLNVGSANGELTADALPENYYINEDIVVAPFDRTPPSTPQNVRVIATTGSEIAVQWAPSTDAEGNVASYRVTWGSIYDGPFDARVTDTEGIVLTDLVENRNYYIIVYALDNAGNESGGTSTQGLASN